MLLTALTTSFAIPIHGFHDIITQWSAHELDTPFSSTHDIESYEWVQDVAAYVNALDSSTHIILGAGVDGPTMIVRILGWVYDQHGTHARAIEHLLAKFYQWIIAPTVVTWVDQRGSVTRYHIDDGYTVLRESNPSPLIAKGDGVLIDQGAIVQLAQRVGAYTHYLGDNNRTAYCVYLRNLSGAIVNAVVVFGPTVFWMDEDPHISSFYHDLTVRTAISTNTIDDLSFVIDHVLAHHVLTRGSAWLDPEQPSAFHIGQWTYPVIDTNTTIMRYLLD